MFNILVFGMVIFDRIDNKDYIGGPAVNVSLHMSLQGEKPTLVSAIGQDQLGDTALQILLDNHVDEAYVKIDPKHETGCVDVIVDKHGLPSFEIKRDVAYDYISLTNEQLNNLKKNSYDLLYFGTVVQRTSTTADTLRTLLEQIDFKFRFYDINLREGHYSETIVDFSLKHTDILKLNDDEVKKLIEIFNLDLESEEQCISWIFSKYSVQIIIVTRGGDGVSAFTRTDRFDEPAIKVQVKDTVGAGDAFSAGFIMNFIKTGDIKSSIKKGNILGASVASKTGAVPQATMAD